MQVPDNDLEKYVSKENGGYYCYLASDNTLISINTPDFNTLLASGSLTRRIAQFDVPEYDKAIQRLINRNYSINIIDNIVSFNWSVGAIPAGEISALEATQILEIKETAKQLLCDSAWLMTTDANPSAELTTYRTDIWNIYNTISSADLDTFVWPVKPAELL